MRREWRLRECFTVLRLSHPECFSRFLNVEIKVTTVYPRQGHISCKAPGHCFDQMVTRSILVAEVGFVN